MAQDVLRLEGASESMCMTILTMICCCGGCRLCQVFRQCEDQKRRGIVRPYGTRIRDESFLKAPGPVGMPVAVGLPVEVEDTQNVWLYNEGKHSYTAVFGDETCLFKESGGAEGVLNLSRGGWWVGDVNVGIVRLQQQPDGSLLSQFKETPESNWGVPNIAYKVKDIRAKEMKSSHAGSDPRSHPFVRMGKGMAGFVSTQKEKRKEARAKKKAQRDAMGFIEKKKKKNWFGREIDSSSDEEEEDRNNVATNFEAKDMNAIEHIGSYDPTVDQDDDFYEAESFRPGKLPEEINPHPFMVTDIEDFEDYMRDFSEENPPPPIPQALFDKLDYSLQQKINRMHKAQPIERLGPEDFAILNEAMTARHPNLKGTKKIHPEEKLARAVEERLKKFKKSTHLNGLIAFGKCEYATANIGNITVPDIINVSGHNGFGGNIGVNGVYKRYPDNYHGRAVYQKVLEREEWESEEQLVQTTTGQLIPATLESGGRTFPTIHDSAEARDVLRKTMRYDKVLPAKRAHGCTGDFRVVHKKECWFLFFDNKSGAWCIGPKPGSDLAFARCRGVEEAVPDNLGPEAWEIFDVGRRMWIKCDRLRTRKGGETKTLPAW